MPRDHSPSALRPACSAQLRWRRATGRAGSAGNGSSARRLGSRRLTPQGRGSSLCRCWARRGGRRGPRRDPSGEKAKSGGRGRRTGNLRPYARAESAALDTCTANARPHPELPSREYARPLVTSSFAVSPRVGSGRRHDALRKPIVLARRHPVVPALDVATELPRDAAATQKRSRWKPRSWGPAACAASAARSPTGAAMLGS